MKMETVSDCDRGWRSFITDRQPLRQGLIEERRGSMANVLSAPSEELEA